MISLKDLFFNSENTQIQEHSLEPMYESRVIQLLYQVGKRNLIVLRA